MKRIVIACIISSTALGLLLVVNLLKLDNEGYDYWQLKMVKLFYNNEFKPFDNENTRDFPVKIESNNGDLSLINHSNLSFFTFAFFEKQASLNIHFVETYESKKDTLSIQLEGCGTGMFLSRIDPHEKLKIFEENFESEIRNQYSSRSEENLPLQVSFSYSCLIFTLPWNKHPSSNIYSPPKDYTKQEIIELLSK